ncbi:hypothetical protein [Duck adenovirus 1]|uniref:Uncharacterized protein n=3 Tax=Duck atadenovirus A TaxID=130328 RepID=O11427_DADV1|nr:hypothetical protein DaV1gp21 [Duck atadenovirus A]AGS11283.1 hypothetical protein [Duck adenovirus 1]AJA72342.1 hypothetical protein [Duck adenovirus 1]AJA72371.1 hypothetical protein [Duck adenovirus 1]AJA72400.1 hypothetical protein [Duck adenovirus 1]AJA72429.1 hypothetical protein [Duck adenovirus 1]
MILLHLPSRSIAAAAIAVPTWQPLLRTRSFIKRNVRRFEHIRSETLEMFVKELRWADYEVKTIPCDECREYTWRTLSNHCVHCLLMPHILLEPLESTLCFCIDHLWLAGLDSAVVWEPVRWWEYDFKSCPPWPRCFATTISQSELAHRLETATIKEERRRENDCEIS